MHNRGKFEERLRNVENRLTKIETLLATVATKNEISKLRIWALAGALFGVLGTFGLLAGWVLRNA